MQTERNDRISIAAARALRGGSLPHLPPPASPVGSMVTLTLEAAEDAAPEVVFSDPQREDGWRAAMHPAEPGLWHVEIRLPAEPTILYYHFILSDGRVIREKRQLQGLERVMRRDQAPRPLDDPDALARRMAPTPEVLIEKPLYGQWKEQDFRVAVYLPEGAPPGWVRGRVFYQIFPDRFHRAGDTPRRERTYDMPAKHLPWGAPPEHPPKGRDFFGGTLRGVTEKLDYLAGLGVDCVYFTPIFESPSNHRYDAVDYHRIDPQLGDEDDLRELIRQAGERGIRVLLDAVFNHCSSQSIYFRAAQQSKQSPYYRWFHFLRWPAAAVGWAGVKTMPEFVECPEVEAFFFGSDGVAQRWLSLGTSGWRTDVTPWLSDGFWRRFRAAVRRDFPEAFLIAEDWGDASHRLVGTTFDATMNYRFANAVVGWAGGKLNALELDDRLETLRRDTPPAVFHAQLNLIDSHDTARARTLLGGSAQRQKLAAALQFAYPGAPMIYSGDEVGQEGAYAENSRRPFPWDDYDRELHEYYRRLIAARKSTDALRYGDVETAWIDPRGGYAFVRRAGNETVLAVFNNGETALSAEIPLQGAENGLWTDLFGLLPNARVEGEALRVELPPLGAAAFRAPA
jgi:glycosidase